ncbi:multiprotein-bridging factor 1 family protein [Sphingorhabdus arenilitoris]|uniref:Multiprotein-bridging factor 1 family protein n=1 Tax=Sphingorhabdus arenilitoris TaxID=1490041 RepID=A0ABV8RIX8_9SPHN
MTDIDADLVSQKIREEIARRRLSRQQLADMAKISLSTLEKALTGKRAFTLSTVIRIEEALSTSLRGKNTGVPAGMEGSGELAPFYLGSYSHEGIKWIEGQYLTIRPSFSNPDDVYSYIITIRWNDDASYLEFAETSREDANFEQTGRVSMPNLSGHIYLVTNDNGQYRLMVLGRPTIDGTLFGLLTTLQVGHGSQLVPVSSPVALVKYNRMAGAAIGSVKPGMPHYDSYRSLIDSALAKDYVRFHS